MSKKMNAVGRARRRILIGRSRPAYATLLVLVLAVPAFALWESDMRLTSSSGTERFNATNAWSVAAGGGAVFAVWQDTRHSAWEIYARRSQDGGVSWSWEQRLTNNPANSMNPSVAYGSGVVHVAYNDDRTGDVELYYNRSTDNGSSWGTEARLTEAPSYSSNPCIAVNGSTVHIVWQDSRNGNPNIYYKRSTDAGLNWGADVRLTTASTGSYNALVAVRGNLVVTAWVDNRDGNTEIYAKRSTDAGLTWGPDQRLTSNSANSGFPSVAISPAGVHVVWNDDRDGNTEIYHKRSTDDGASWGTDVRLTIAASHSMLPSLAADGTLLHIVWQEWRDGNSEVYYKRSGDDGLTWEADTRLTNNPSSVESPSIATMDTMLHVIWPDNRMGSQDIYYKRNPTGNPRPDVGCTRILAPVSGFDSGPDITPACSVRNFSSMPASYRVWMRIYPFHAYQETIQVTGHPAGTALRVTFPAWVPRRGTYTVRCSTMLAGDVQPSNDRLSSSVIVSVDDVGVQRIVFPTGIVDSGTIINPACTLRNYGTGSCDSFLVRMKVGTGYSATGWVPMLLAGGRHYLTFPNWTASPSGMSTVSCSTAWYQDDQPFNNRRLDSVFVRGRYHDVGVCRISAPAGTLDSGTTITPGCSVANYGSYVENVVLRLKVGTSYDQTSASRWISSGQRVFLTFPDWTATSRGSHAVSCSTHITYDSLPGNDKVIGTVAVAVHDIAAVGIITPDDTIAPGAVAPSAVVRNHGTAREAGTVTFLINATPPYAQTLDFADGLSFADTTLVFPNWTAVSGSYTARCSAALAGDQIPGNNVITANFLVSGGGGGGDTGWTRLADLPAGPKGKNVKDGGCLAYKPDSTGEYIYALKGNNRHEFYRYNLATNLWQSRESIPAIGRAGKKKGVKKGAAICAVPYVCDDDDPDTDNDKVVPWAVKGGGTLEYWRYDPRLAGTDVYPWAQRADVPAGTRTLKEGVGMVRVPGSEFTSVYLLKGSGTQEFYRHNNKLDEWTRMADAPLGQSGKAWKNGSTLAFDEPHGRIYALKGSYNELFVYDLTGNVWTPKAGLPLIGSSGRKKKVKDGAGLAYAGGLLYAVKGGNTRELWYYLPDADRWTQLADEPLGGGRNVKGGGGLTSSADALYALKGNNTLEFFKYGFGAMTNDQAPMTNAGVQSPSVGAASLPRLGLRICPNPSFRNPHSAIRIDYSLPTAGNVSLKLYDITGKLVTTLVVGYQSIGKKSYRVRPCEIAAGVYLLRLEAATSSTTAKLVVE